MITVIIASNSAQAALAAEQLEIGRKNWRWANRLIDILGYGKDADFVVALPVLDHGNWQYWECRHELDMRGIKPREVWT